MKTMIMAAALAACGAAGARAAELGLQDAMAQARSQAQGAFGARQASVGSAAEAGTVVRDQTTVVPVELNDKTVKCSQADYGMPTLKILVPGLAELTVLNHRNTREGAPCIAAGRCTPAHGPQNILKSGAGVDQVPVRVTLRKLATNAGDSCSVSLVETVEATIRGVRFFHERFQDVAPRDPADCR